jgi:hypothetical protein
MARPKTKGDQIGVRLSLAATAELERRAAAKGLAVRQYLELSLEAALARQDAPSRGEVDPRFPKRVGG